MIVRETCSECRGAGVVVDEARRAAAWPLCHACDGLGHVFAAGAPAFGCTMTLADRDPGDVVELGTGDRALVRWHEPRKTKKTRPHTTAVEVFGDFGGVSELELVTSELGVRDIVVSHGAGDELDGRGDVGDPLLNASRAVRGALM